MLLLEMSLGNHDLPAAAMIGAIAALAYVLSFARHRRGPFTALDASIVVAIMAIVTAVAAPVLNSASQNAKATALKQNLYTLRTQIERYKAEHRGQAPLLFKEGFPQLVQATNIDGVPGPAGAAHPLGPYLPDGIPLNPYTGASVVRLTETFPPTGSTGSTGGGWLYHQPTGRIAADVEARLEE
ncbi:MAG: type II secretion system protein [Pirellulales bacterium]|nr:type II secretion system protein [Pirellulales bacterium]